MGRDKDEWTTIATKKDTKKRLSEMKEMKSPGEIENYDDVIRRKMNMPLINDYEEI